jgi:uncharacterized phiE125 gp8 family phage protein
MDHTIITAVTAEPVSLAEAKLHLRLDDIGGSHPHDALVTSLISSAREFAEHYTGRALAQQTLEVALDSFPNGGTIDLPRPPVASVTSIKYDDSDNVEQTMSAADYSLSAYGDRRRINLGPDADWPGTYSKADAVRIRYVTGYGATGHDATGQYATCPKAAAMAILLQVELDYPASQLTPAEREASERARDSLLNTIKLWGF